MDRPFFTPMDVGLIVLVIIFGALSIGYALGGCP